MNVQAKGQTQLTGMSIAKGPSTMAATATERLKTATFAMGWFWGPDAQFGAIKGVIRTRVGYTGGTKGEPTYGSLGDHSEAVQIDYDPTQVSYETLLSVFWRGHDPTRPAWSRQYMSVIFYHDEEQKQLALETKSRVASEKGTKIRTKILPASEFTLAETYHQKYRLRQSENLMKELRRLYPDSADFVDSTAAARLNGYLSGHATWEALKAELEALDLPELLDEVRP
jgi:peptide-methionine (S)-S-oxide reductase